MSRKCGGKLNSNFITMEFDSRELANDFAFTCCCQTMIGSFTSGIKTPFQITTLNVMGASCDLFDVSMDI